MRASSSPRVSALVAVAGLVAAVGACHGAGPGPALAPREDASARPCADFELDVERFWSRSSRAEVRAGLLAAGGSVDESVAGRVVTKLDELSRDWVMMQESVCKDTLVRKVTPPDVYTKVSMCLRTTLISQRTLVSSLRAPSREAAYKSDEALATIRQDAQNCQKDAVYSGYPAVRAPESPGLTVGREALGEARAYAALADKKRLAEALARGLAAARGANDPRLLADLLVEEGERLNRFEVDPKAAAVVADEVLAIATRAGYTAAEASAYHIRGNADATSGRVAEALAWHERARALRERVFGLDHPETARTYNAIGVVYLNEREPNDELALSWFRRSLAIREAALGKAHPLTAATCNNIGSVYLRRREFDEAVRWYQRALTVKEGVYGREHPSTAAGLVNLASAFQGKGDVEQALGLYKQALGIQERALGADHPDVGATMNNLAYAYDASGHFADALPWYRRALAIFTAKLGPTHPRTNMARDGVTTTCAKLPGACTPP